MRERAIRTINKMENENDKREEARKNNEKLLMQKNKEERNNHNLLEVDESLGSDSDVSEVDEEVVALHQKERDTDSANNVNDKNDKNDVNNKNNKNDKDDVNNKDDVNDKDDMDDMNDANDVNSEDEEEEDDEYDLEEEQELECSLKSMLRSVPISILRNIDVDDQSVAVRWLDVSFNDAGDVLMRQGVKSETVYILMAGELDAVIHCPYGMSIFFNFQNFLYIYILIYSIFLNLNFFIFKKYFF